MSQPNPKYKRLEALLSEAKQVAPEPDRAPGDPEAEKLKALAAAPDPNPPVRAADQQVKQPEAQASAPEAQPADRLVEPTMAQVAVQEVKPADQLASLKAAVRKAATRFQLALFPKEKSTATAEAATDKQAQLALWAAGIFAFLGLLFFLFSLFNVFVLQQGQARCDGPIPHTGNDPDDDCWIDRLFPDPARTACRGALGDICGCHRSAHIDCPCPRGCICPCPPLYRSSWPWS